MHCKVLRRDDSPVHHDQSGDAGHQKRWTRVGRVSTGRLSYPGAMLCRHLNTWTQTLNPTSRRYNAANETCFAGTKIALDRTCECWRRFGPQH